MFVYAFKLHHELSKLSSFFALCLITNKPPNMIFPTNPQGMIVMTDVYLQALLNVIKCARRPMIQNKYLYFLEHAG